MPYEHQKEVTQAAGSILELADILTDPVPDEQQVALLIAQVMETLAPLMSAMSAEEKREYKTKFLLKLLFAIGSRLLDKTMPDAES